MAKGQPGGAGRPHNSPLMKLAIRPKPEADRGDDGDAVGEGEDVDPVPAAEPGDGDGDAQHAAVEAHAALPDGDNVQRMPEEGAGLVEQHIADPPAENDAKRRPGEEIIHLQRRRDRGRPLRNPPHQSPAEHEAGDIGNRIPVDGEGAELDQNRVEIRKDERLHRADHSWKWPMRRALVAIPGNPISTAHRLTSLLAW